MAYRVSSADVSGTGAGFSDQLTPFTSLPGASVFRIARGGDGPTHAGVTIRLPLRTKPSGIRGGAIVNVEPPSLRSMLETVHEAMLVRGGSGGQRPGAPRKPQSRRSMDSNMSGTDVAVDPATLAADWAATIAVTPVFTTCLSKLSMKVVLPLAGVEPSPLGAGLDSDPAPSDPGSARSTSVLLSCILRNRDAVVAARADAVADTKWRKRGLMSWMRSFTPPRSEYRVQLQLQTSQLPAAQAGGAGVDGAPRSPGADSAGTGESASPARSTGSPPARTKKRGRRARAPPCAAWRPSRQPAGLLVAEDEWLLCTILAAGSTRELALSSELSGRGLVPLVAVAAHTHRSSGPSPPVNGSVFSHGLPTMLGTGLGAHVCGTGADTAGVYACGSCALTPRAPHARAGMFFTTPSRKIRLVNTDSRQQAASIQANWNK